MFLTTAEFLPQHHAQREQALQIITAAEANGRARLAEMNQQVAGKLKITLDQRITVRYQMKGMTACYICHHLEAALLTELPAGGSRIGGHRLVRLVTFPGHDRTGRLPRDLAALAVARIGALRETGDLGSPISWLTVMARSLARWPST